MMRKEDVVVGWTYEMKVSWKMAFVRIDGVADLGGWYGRNLKTRNAIVVTDTKLRSMREITKLQRTALMADHRYALRLGN